MSMPIGRMVPHLQGAAEVRQWMVKNIPFTDTMIGYDLFVKIGTDMVAGIPLTAENIGNNLSYTDKQVRLHLVKLMQAGLLVPATGKESGDPMKLLVPTVRLVALLEAYAKELDHVYALRKTLRQRQMHQVATHAELGDLVELIYDHFHDLGWLYLHNYGAICFLMATLVQNVARLHGYRARSVSGYVEVFRATDGHCFQLGGKTHLSPGQIAGHAFCVIEESMIVDFGLGNVRRYYHRDFPWGLGCAYQPQPPVQGSLPLPGGDTVIWKDDWRYPDSEAEFAKFKPVAAQMAEQYRLHFGIDPRRQPGPAPAAAPDSEAMPLDAPPLPAAAPQGLPQRPRAS